MSRAKCARLLIQVLSCGAALMVFLAIEGIFFAVIGFFGTWVIGSGVARAVFKQLATPEELQSETRPTD